MCVLMDSSESDQPVSSALLNEVRECCQQPQLESQSHLSLRQHLDSMSIFTGRNPLVSMCIIVIQTQYDLLFFNLQVMADLDPNVVIKQSPLVVEGTCL